VTNLSVLIIEDNELNQDLARDILENDNLKTFVAETAEKGLEIALKQQPNIILMDLHLPDKDGYVATQELKSNTATSDIPILAFTASAMPEEMERINKTGFDGVIIKPIDVKTFAKTVKSYMDTSADQKTDLLSTAQAGTISTDSRGTFKLIHDVKTPLNGLKSALELLHTRNNENFTSFQKALISDMLGAHTDLTEQINQLILKLSQK
jgi:CheY-like chemotaxis protein